MLKPENDGITHINIYSKGKTQLGRFLSNFSDCNVMTDDGPFRTIEGYWYWLSTHYDELRVLPGFACKTRGRAVGGKDWMDEDNFRQKILKAIAVKVLSNDWCVQQMKQSDLPLVHYYVYGSKVIEVKDGLWMLSFLDFLRNELKESGKQ